MAIRTCPGVFLLAALCFGFVGCFAVSSVADERAKTSEDGLMIEDKSFENVPLGTNEPNACTPADPDEFWEGMLINAPARIVLEAGPAKGVYKPLEPIPVCGFYRVEMAGLAIGDSLQLLARQQGEESLLIGGAGEKDPSPDEPPPDDPPLDNSMFEGVLTSDYFNVDLAEALNIPNVPATYEVWAKLGKFESNIIKLEIVSPGS